MKPWTMHTHRGLQVDLKGKLLSQPPCNPLHAMPYCLRSQYHNKYMHRRISIELHFVTLVRVEYGISLALGSTLTHVMYCVDSTFYFTFAVCQSTC